MAPTISITDIQCGFDRPVWGVRNNLDAEANAARLLAVWRMAGGNVSAPKT